MRVGNTPTPGRLWVLSQRSRTPSTVTSLLPWPLSARPYKRRAAVELKNVPPPGGLPDHMQKPRGQAQARRGENQKLVHGQGTGTPSLRVFL